MTNIDPAEPAPVSPVKPSFFAKVSAFVKVHKYLSIGIAVVVVALIVVGMVNGVHPGPVGRGH